MTTAIAWIKPAGSEFAIVGIEGDRMTAEGVAIGSHPDPYRLDYALTTAAGFVTARFEVEARGRDFRRRLTLERSDGGWTADGAPLDGFDRALDVDLALSPLTNTMPVLRHGVLSGGSSPELLMAWISVPDLTVHASPQRYEHAGDALVHFESEGFAADIAFEGSGLVVDYPGIGRRIGG